MAVDNSKVTLVSECFVKPKYEGTNKPHHLIGKDLTFLSFRYIQTGLLYKKTSTNDFNMNAFVAKMKQAFSHALIYYYPLAGRLVTVKYEDEQACSIHVDCDNSDKGPGARFIHASALGTGVCVSDIVSHTISEEPIIRYFFDLGETGVVGYDGHTRALVSLQLTELDDGVFIGIAMNHSLVDFSSWLHFVNSLSELCGSDNINTMNITREPVFKPVLPEGCSLIQKLPYLEPREFIRRIDNNPQLQERIFHFSALSMAKLKSKANSEYGGTDLTISSFQALAAMLWISINRAKKAPAQEMTTCVIPIDCRGRFRPPLSPDQFGNLAQTVKVTRNIGELMEKGLGWASMVLNQGVTAYNDQVANQYLKEVMQNPSIPCIDEANLIADKFNLVNFAGGSRFDLYGLDFGFGKAIAVRGGNNNKRSGMAVVNCGRDGIGSVYLEVYLLPESMLALESDEAFMAYASVA